MEITLLTKFQSIMAQLARDIMVRYSHFIVKERVLERFLSSSGWWYSRTVFPYDHRRLSLAKTHSNQVPYHIGWGKKLISKALQCFQNYHHFLWKKPFRDRLISRELHCQTMRQKIFPKKTTSDRRFPNVRSCAQHVSRAVEFFEKTIAEHSKRSI